MSQAPEGWYPDPELRGQQRYWDGTTWTDHRAPGAGQQQWAGQWGSAGPQTPGSAIAALVCGILAVLGCMFFTGIPAMVLGRRAKREIEQSGGALTGEGLATAGFVTGLIGTIWSVLGAILLIVVIAVGGVAAYEFGQSCETVTDENGNSTITCD